MLLLGVVQAQAIGATPVAAGSFDLLQSEVLGSSAASVTFSNLDTYAALGYTNLQIRCALTAVADRTILMQFNADTATTYSYHGLEGTGSSVASFASTSTSSMLVGVNPAGSAFSSAGIIDILDPYETTKYTTVRSLWGAHLGGATQRIQLLSGNWRNTAALTSIKLQYNTSDFTIGSRFSLYGSK